MRLSSSSVLGFSTFGALGPSPPPGDEGGRCGFWIRSGIKIIMCVNVFRKFKLSQIVHGFGRVNDLEPQLNLARIEEIAKVDFDGALGAAKQNVIPLGRLDHRPEFLDTATPDSGTSARRG